MTPSDIERVKDLLPTSLGSDDIREQIAADILRRSVFSARMASVPYLAKVREVCVAMLDGTWYLATCALRAYRCARGSPPTVRTERKKRNNTFIRHS